MIYFTPIPVVSNKRRNQRYVMGAMPVSLTRIMQWRDREYANKLQCWRLILHYACLRRKLQWHSIWEKKDLLKRPWHMYDWYNEVVFEHIIVINT